MSIRTKNLVQKSFANSEDASLFFSERASFGKSFQFLYQINTEPDNVYYIDETVNNPILLNSSPGVPGSSTLFPNGYNFITEDYVLQASDEGKLIISLGETPVHITVPTGSDVFTNKIIGISMISPGDFEIEPGVAVTPLHQTNDGLGIGDLKCETVICQTFVGDGINGLSVLSTSVINDNGSYKTMLRYLYDNQGGGTPAGSDTQIQYNNAGAFGASSDLIWDNVNKLFIAGDFGGSANHTYIGVDDTSSVAVVNGLKNTIPAHTTTPVFTGSGLDNLIVDGGYYSGIGTTNYTITIDGTNKDVIKVDSISGSGFLIGETVTSTSGGSATIVSVTQTASITEIVLSGTTGTFVNSDTITGLTSGTTGTETDDLYISDTFTWTDGTTTKTNVPCGNDLIPLSYDISVSLGIGGNTGHTFGDSWTFDGVPAVTNYGGMLYLNGLSKNVSLGDINGITGSNRAFLSLDSSNGTSGVISKIFRLRTTSGNTFLNADATNGSYIFGASDFGNNTKLDLSDSDQAATLVANNSFSFQNAATTNFLYIDTAGTAQFGGQSWKSGLKADDTAGTTIIGNWNDNNNETKVIVNDLTQLITITNVPTYADDAAATGAGLTTGQLYKTTTLGSTFLKIVP